MPDLSNPIVDLYAESQSLKGPLKATLAKRAKSYSDFYEAATTYLENARREKPVDVFSQLDNATDDLDLANGFEELEAELLDESQEEFQYVSE
jgi:hypothetical protein